MSRLITVTLQQDGEDFIAGEFEVRAEDTEAVLPLLPEMGLDRERAEAILSGYMHASDLGQVTEDMGKMALVAAVYMLEVEGEDNLKLDLETPTEAPAIPT